jgi:nicotinamidase-related amidase
MRGPHERERAGVQAMTALSCSALLPIDVQRGFDFPPWGRRCNPDMEANGRALLAAWRQLGWPLIHIRHDSISPQSTLRPGQEGHRFRDGFEPIGDEPVVGKTVNCAFVGTDLELRLRRLEMDTVVLFGVSTDMCVSTTARIASNLGFRTLVVGDASFCFDLAAEDGTMIAAESIQAAHLATLRAEFAETVRTMDVLSATERQRASTQPATFRGHSK